MAEFDQQRMGAGAATRAADLDAGLRAYMLRVYNYMALGVAFTAGVTLFMGANPELMAAVALGPMKWVLFAGVLGLGWFAPKLIFSNAGSTTLAHVCFWAYAGMWGLLISPMIYAFMNIPNGAGMIAQAFLITSVMFGATSLYGYTTKRDLSAFGRFFFMASVGLIVAMLANVFIFQSIGFSFVISSIVVLLFAAVTAYETQMVKELYSGGDTGVTTSQKAIFGAFALYGSFIVMFIHILNLLGIMRSE